MRRIIGGVAAILVIGVTAGPIYERIGKRRDAKRMPRVGKAIDIGGRSLNIYCSGSGRPSVILDSGGSAPGYSNMPLQKLISQETRCCWFDRAGLGWSDPSPVTQTSAAVASDLHALLHAAQISPPYRVVGQSFSGFNVRVFTKTYPSEVAGVVLLDSVQEDQQRYEPRSTIAPVNRLPAVVRDVLGRAVPLAENVGLVRLLMSGSRPDQRIRSAVALSEAEPLNRLESQPNAIVVSSGCSIWEKSAAEARAA